MVRKLFSNVIIQLVLFTVFIVFFVAAVYA